MVKTDLPYTYIAKGRYWRFRHPATGDCKLPGKPGDAAFHIRYGQLRDKVDATPAPVSRESFTWLIARYKAGEEFRNLRDATQLDYGKTLDLIEEHLGVEPFRLTSRPMVKAVRDKYMKTARKAHKIKQMVSRLYSWADENDLVPAGYNPATGIKRIKPKDGTREYVVWSEAEFSLFVSEAIRPMHTAAMIARYTGQRVEDIARMTWQQFQGDIVRVRQSKTGAFLDIACHSALRKYLDDLRRDQAKAKSLSVMILTSAAGKPYNANSLSSAVGREVKRIDGMPERSLHGLRYMAGSDMEEAGCTVGEIESVLGHQTFKMALKYASQRLRAKVAIEKVEQA